MPPFPFFLSIISKEVLNERALIPTLMAFTLMKYSRVIAYLLFPKVLTGFLINGILRTFLEICWKR
ncbi:hypothetical protein CDL12_02370 [Handroanthus impetiginosus]|uniref:Uncharacterized protein n=1 Tax=Handroanthus impetiginosus TaxID=429701 RepID=A0A2G9I564_9LAMI|nr:hypothetical protein CDL12_02370 [Handroanthus impetiginosus]